MLLEIIKDINDIVGTMAVIAGGIWVLYKFGLYRERFPSMEIVNGFNYVSENEHNYLIELYCIVENKGKVRKWVSPLDFALLHLKKGEAYQLNPGRNNEVHMDNLFKRTYWVSPDWFIPFVDGNSKRTFTYIAYVPKNVDCLSLYTRFIDFNSKKKAIDFFNNLHENKQKNDNEYNLPFKEKIEANLKKESDFYNTRLTLSIETIKKNSGKESTGAGLEP